MRATHERQLVIFFIKCHEFLGQPRIFVNLVAERDAGKDDVPDEDVAAETFYVHTSNRVELWLNPSVMAEKNEARQRHIMLHEALHSVHVGIDRVVWASKDLMQTRDHDQLFARYHTARELMVDGLTMALEDMPHVKKLWREAIAEGARG